MPAIRVVAITVVYGERWKFLTRVIEAVLKDPYIETLIVIDNACFEGDKLDARAKESNGRIVVLRQEKNIGSAGAFSKGLEHARNLECSHVFLLDDDSVPEEGCIEKFVRILDLFPDKKIVLSANRSNVLDNSEYFYKIPTTDSPRKTFFEVFSFRKMAHFFSLIFFPNKKKRGPFVPVVPNEAFVYGGALIPIDAIRQAPLPDASLFLYGDDIEYSWNIKKLGYGSYLCHSPKLEDIDLTFGTNRSHIFGQFDSQTSPFKVYYRLRNMVRLSRKHSKQGEFVLLINVLAWTAGLFILGFIRVGPTSIYFHRVNLLSKAVYAGYFPHSKVAKNTESSFF
jgi:GT2 family glycosyltransferase